jgi:GT2 family glycosyltransferase
VEVVDVAWFSMDPQRFVGRHLESPLAGVRLPDAFVEVSGWALGRVAPVVAIEIVVDRVVLRRIPVRLQRPDVADAHPEISGALRTGFRGGVSIRGGTGRSALLIRAVFADAAREPIASVTVRRQHDAGYADLVERIRTAVDTRLDQDAGLVVIHEGDFDLLRVGRRRTWAFPAAELEPLRESWPANAVAAVAHLEALRAEGGDALVVPRTAFWWLEHFPGFRHHLERRYPLLLDDADCRVFRLANGDASRAAPGLQPVISEARERLGRDPVILSLDPRGDLAARFPDDCVFSPPLAAPSLPYLDGTVDLVVTRACGWISRDEAHRVASLALVTYQEKDLVTAAPEAPRIYSSDGAILCEWLQGAPTAALPSVSIVTPCHNAIAHTRACLRALALTIPSFVEAEVLVVDDASTDATPLVLEGMAEADRRLRVLRSEENVGFVESCNRGAAAAQGDVLVFLNNDTLPQPGWLTALVRTLRDHPDAGAAGGKLVYADGMLQEAGGVVFSDGSAANFGRGDYDPDAPLYGYVREVDYASGALLATWRALFEELGRFDDIFRPGYYEDTDFCFRVRAAGRRVYYQPEAVVLHLEGVSAGTDPTTGMKRYQELNRIKFVNRWRTALARQPTRPASFDTRTWYALAHRLE